jgi:DNA-binding LacI/PurR family transcriptional regulator/signal transduction histidine kinase
MSEETSERRHIAFLTNSIEYAFYTDILKGIRTELDGTGIALSVYVGGSLISSPLFAAGENIIYRLANDASVDGIIILGDLARETTPEAYSAFCESFDAIPRISIGYPLESGLNVRVDHATGIKALLRHLIDAHGYRRIACISGPEGNLEAEQKLAEYRAALEQRGLYDPSLVAQGDYSYLSGRHAAAELVRRHGTRLDAIFALSDGMAVAAKEELRDTGYSIPQDIAIVAFNDTIDLLHHDPPMTTIDQNLIAQGRLAARALISRILGAPEPMDLSVKTRMIVRESCGCSFEPGSLPAALDQDAGTFDLPGLFSRLYEKLTSETWSAADASASAGHEGGIRRLIAPLRDNPSSRETGEIFSAAIRELLAEDGNSEEDLEFWHKFLMLVQSEMHLHVGLHGRDFETVDHVIHEGIRMVSAALFRVRAAQKQSYKALLLHIKYFSQFINASVDLNTLVSHILRQLPGFGIKRGIAALYASGIFTAESGAELPPESKIIAAFDPEGTRSLSPEESLIPTGNLRPQELFGPGCSATMIVMPLYFRKEHFGWMAMEYDPAVKPMIYSTLSGLISGALNVIFTLNNLRTMRSQIKQTSRLAELGELTSGISHELRNPLNAIVNFAMLDGESLEELEALLPRLARNGSGEALGKARDIIGDLRSSNRSIRNQGDSAVSIISSILKQARGDGGRVENFDLNQLLGEILVLVYHSTRSRYPNFSYRVNREFLKSMPPYRGNLAQLNRAFMNIITNAVDAMRYRAEKEPDFEAELTVRTGTSRDRISIDVIDNGTGIPDDVRERVYEAFFTTKPTSEGTGLGLKIAYEIIVEGHGGELFCESEPGRYTRFTALL